MNITHKSLKRDGTTLFLYITYVILPFLGLLKFFGVPVEREVVKMIHYEWSSVVVEWSSGVVEWSSGVVE